MLLLTTSGPKGMLRKDVDSLSAFNLYWRIFESDNMSIDFAGVFKQEDCYI